MNLTKPFEIPELICAFQKMEEAELLFINKELVKIIKSKRKQKTTEQSRQFFPGDRVSWVSRRGITDYGRVEKVNRITLKVKRDDGSLWNVHISGVKKIV